MRKWLVGIALAFIIGVAAANEVVLYDFDSPNELCAWRKPISWMEESDPRRNFTLIGHGDGLTQGAGALRVEFAKGWRKGTDRPFARALHERVDWTRAREVALDVLVISDTSEGTRLSPEGTSLNLVAFTQEKAPGGPRGKAARKGKAQGPTAAKEGSPKETTPVEIPPQIRVVQEYELAAPTRVRPGHNAVVFSLHPPKDCDLSSFEYLAIEPEAGFQGAMVFDNLRVSGEEVRWPENKPIPSAWGPPETWPRIYRQSVERNYPETMTSLYVDGACAHLFWKDVEPEQGRYQWDAVEAILNKWAVNGKKVWLGIYPIDKHGKTPEARESIPAWVFALGVPRLSPASNWPAFWDPRFIEKWGAFVRAYGRRYDGDPRLGVVQCGVTAGELPDPCKDDPTLRPEAERLGYSEAAFLRGVTGILDAWRVAFRKSPLEIDGSATAIALPQIMEYCARNGIAMKANYLAPGGWTGRFEQGVLRWRSAVPFAFESLCNSAGSFCYYTYWEPLKDRQFAMKQLDGHVNYTEQDVWQRALSAGVSVLMPYEQQVLRADPKHPLHSHDVEYLFQMCRTHLGKTPANAPSVWCRVRGGWGGNYEFGLRQVGPSLERRAGPFGGRRCRATDQEDGEGLMRFAVDEAFAARSSAGKAAEVVVEYLDEGNDAFTLAYRSKDGVKRAETVRKTGTGEWLDHTFVLPDARWGAPAGATVKDNLRADFAIDALGDGAETIGFVAVTWGHLPLYEGGTARLDEAIFYPMRREQGDVNLCAYGLNFLPSVNGKPYPWDRCVYDAGRMRWFTDAANGLRYLGYSVEDRFARSARHFELIVEYQDIGTDAFTVEAAASEGLKALGSMRNLGVVRKSGSEQYRFARFDLDSPAFASSDVDIRIDAGTDGDERIGVVMLRRKP